MVQNYPAYTHENVFNLSWSEVMTIVALGKDRSYIEGEMHKDQLSSYESHK